MKIVFTTDLHGEVWKYERLLKVASDFRAAVVINGGDMLPKGGNLLDDHMRVLNALITPSYRLSISERSAGGVSNLSL